MFFCLHAGMPIRCVFFKCYLRFYGLLARDKARTEVLPIAITIVQPIYHWSANMYWALADIRASRYIVLAIYRQ